MKQEEVGPHEISERCLGLAAEDATTLLADQCGPVVVDRLVCGSGECTHEEPTTPCAVAVDIAARALGREPWPPWFARYTLAHWPGAHPARQAPLRRFRLSPHMCVITADASR